MGPTASGKTDLAVELVRRFPFEIISVDSAMVYRGMDIGTAKPEADVLQAAPHRLIDILDPAEAYSAAQFRADALREMADIRAAGAVPLLVGGTMLYYRALERGLSDLPPADPDLRAALEAEAARIGWAAMHERLGQSDPVAAARIHANDPQRIQRALEVIELTGRPMSELQGHRPGPGSLPWRFIKLALLPGDREVLRQRIKLRFRQMIDKGFLEEVRHLKARGDLHAGLPSMRAVGYRQAWEYLQGERDPSEWVEAGIAATRQYAKRQLTWLRSEQGVQDFDCLDPAKLDRIGQYLAKELTLRDPIS